MDPTRRLFIQSGAAMVAAVCVARRSSAWSGAEVHEPAPAPLGRAGGVADEFADPVELDGLLASLPSFACSRRREWVLASDCPKGAASSTLDLLEATTTQVTRVARVLGIQPRASTTRHLAVLFERVEDYRNFAQRHDDYREPGAIGHYAPHARRAMLTAASASPALRAAIAQLDGAQASDGHARQPRAAVTGFGRGSARGASPRVWASIDTAIDEIRQRTMRLTAHEAAHQVLCERRVHPIGGACPAWLGEGFACCFETERSIGDFGPDFDVPARRERLQQALATNAIQPLGAVIASHGRPALSGAIAVDWYAQCWGLVAWLYREHPSQLAAYIEAIWDGRGGATGAERIGAFERVVGSLTKLEPAWRAAWQPRDDDRPHATPAIRPAARTAT